MTLDTSIYILDPIDVEELFAWGNTNLIKPPTTPRVRRWSIGDVYYGTELRTDAGVANVIGQGFDAIFEIFHKDGQLIDPLEGVDEDEQEYYKDRPKHYAEIRFDTAYGFSGPLGWGATTLHASYIVALFEHLKEMGVAMAWQNEYNGDINYGLTGLDTFLNDGDSALDWYQNVAKPAIERSMKGTK